MNTNSFRAQLQTCNIELNRLGLIERFVENPPEPDNPGATYRKMDYMQAWQYTLKERYYHFELKDSSLLHFRVESYNPLKVTYTYLGCPFEPKMTYEEFVRQNLYSDLDTVGDYFLDEFENFVDEPLLKSNITYIRYDYDPKNYIPARHPASHIHFGFGTTVRVGVKKILLPTSFILFILRQCYPDSWIKFLDGTNPNTLIRNVRENLDSIEEGHWCSKDEWEMCLT